MKKKLEMLMTPLFTSEVFPLNMQIGEFVD